MDNVNKNKLLYRLIILLWGFFTLINPTFGADGNKKSKVESKTQGVFALTVKANLISLDAKDASLNQIVEEIGSKMQIDVHTEVPDEKKITIKFDNLSMKDAIERLRTYADIVYFKDSQNKKITKIMVFPKRRGEELSKPAKGEGSIKTENKREETLKETPQPEPFKFEFDPSKSEEGK